MAILADILSTMFQRRDPLPNDGCTSRLYIHTAPLADRRALAEHIFGEWSPDAIVISMLQGQNSHSFVTLFLPIKQTMDVDIVGLSVADGPARLKLADGRVAETPMHLSNGLRATLVDAIRSHINQDQARIIVLVDAEARSDPHLARFVDHHVGKRRKLSEGLPVTGKVLRGWQWILLSLYGTAMHGGGAMTPAQVLEASARQFAKRGVAWGNGYHLRHLKHQGLVKVCRGVVRMTAAGRAACEELRAHHF